MTFAEARTRVAKLSYLYHHELGGAGKARVALLADNHPSVALSFLAFSNIRVTTIPMQPAWPPEEILAALKHTQATHVAVTAGVAPRLREILNLARVSLPIIEIDRKQGGEYDSSYTVAPDQIPLETDPILLLRTSGYAGAARWCVFNHRQILAAASAIRSHYRLGAADRVASTLPWAHPFSFVHGLLLPLLNGATCVTAQGFTGVELSAYLGKTRVSRLVSTPPDVAALFAANPQAPAGLRSITVGMGALAPEMAASIRQLGVQVSHCYGLTEALWTLVMEDTQPIDPTTPPPIRCVGTGLPGFKYKILDPNGDELISEDLKTGPLAATSPTLMQGYFGKGLEMETKNVLRGTWLYTGDIVTIEPRTEEEGGPRFRFLGRRDDVLYVNEQYASMNRINTALRKIAGVADGAAFTVKNLKHAWVIGCVVVKVPTATLTLDQLLAQLRAALPEQLVPHAAFFTDHIPRDTYQNIHYGKLRGQFAGLVT